jgi:hypothetical protein
MARVRTMAFGWLLPFLLAPALPARAQQVMQPGPVPHTYALLIGKNPGGPGQTALRYAEEDARRMARVLGELGRVPKAQTQVLLGPDRTAVLSALDTAASALARHRARGERAYFLFYYSGHARANAIHLGDEELALGELRTRILALPSTLTLVVLDACQSGGFSTVKGAEPSAEFSYNSVAQLQTSGVAVMASSSPTELSQESAALHGSYFTHHLIVALRGAGDSDGNGVVSLSEAYRYAYDRTLSSTMRTAVGRQHVTLETALKGHGDVPITYPAEARAQLELPAELAADVLVEHATSVVAELHKVSGAALRLALPRGAYSAVLRQGNDLSVCELALRDGEVTPLRRERCAEISETEAQAKGYFEAEPAKPEPPREAFGIELGFGLGSHQNDGYTERLSDFGFHEQVDLLSDSRPFRFTLALSRQLSQHLSGVVDVRNLDSRAYERDLLSTSDAARTEHFEWSGYALGLHLRGHVDLFTDLLRPYAQLGGGLGYAHSRFDGDAEYDFGLHFAASAGMFWMPFRHFGLGLQATYTYAPVLENELDQHHDSGGVTVGLNLRYRSWEQP